MADRRVNCLCNLLCHQLLVLNSGCGSRRSKIFGLKQTCISTRPLLNTTKSRSQRVNPPGTPTNHLKWMEMVISNHFLCKDWVHHPIENDNHLFQWLAALGQNQVCLTSCAANFGVMKLGWKSRCKQCSADLTCVFVSMSQMFQI